MRLSSPARIARLGLLAFAGASLVLGVAGGLARLGLAMPAGAANATVLHGTLMIGGFLGTVIGIERAVALGGWSGFLAPLGSGLAALALIGGYVVPGAWLLVLASTALVAVGGVLARRQFAAHTVLLLVASCAWLGANVLFALGAGGDAIFSWGFAFLVLTIAAERLELTRLAPRRPGAQPLLLAVVATLLAGTALTVWRPIEGAVVYGLALVALAAWLFAFDVARRTIRLHGLARYAAVCLLGGYTWLAIAGAAWVGVALFGWPVRDLALHALALGFVLSMIFAHAPIIAPAIARVKIAFGPYFYVAPVALHLSLLVRFVPGLFYPGDPGARVLGGVLNALTLAAFAIVMVYAIYRGARINRRANPAPVAQS
jgi:hypothetical protein